MNHVSIIITIGEHNYDDQTNSQNSLYPIFLFDCLIMFDDLGYPIFINHDFEKLTSAVLQIH
jgi:hypothetical protein